MPPEITAPATIQTFITKWELSGGAERANAQTFLGELWGLIGVPAPDLNGPVETASPLPPMWTPSPPASKTRRLRSGWKRSKGCWKRWRHWEGQGEWGGGLNRSSYS